MLEYALIMATVVTAFAVASMMGVDKFWTNNLDDARNKDYLVLSCEPDCVNAIDSLNQRIEYR
ncbi:MAG: hypothetical protein QOK05_2773 [Chloroflexota bacterium]|nr:hypothetical protein [Chloroflexota bacterium]